MQAECSPFLAFFEKPCPRARSKCGAFLAPVSLTAFYDLRRGKTDAGAIVEGHGFSRADMPLTDFGFSRWKFYAPADNLWWLLA